MIIWKLCYLANQDLTLKRWDLRKLVNQHFLYQKDSRNWDILPSKPNCYSYKHPAIQKTFYICNSYLHFFFQLAEKPNNASLEKWKHQSKSQRSMVIRSWYYTKAYWRVVTSKISSITRIVMKVSLIRLKLKLN